MHLSLEQFLGWSRSVFRLCLPVECTACGTALSDEPVPFFCRACWTQIHPYRGPACVRCDQPFVSAAATAFIPTRYCQNCEERPPAYRRAWTLFPYVPPLQDAICSFKYRGKVGLAKPLARLMVTALQQSIDADLLVPIPLHPTRLRMREFNQSLLLADELGRHFGQPVSSTDLIRARATEPQTMLSRKDRLRNLGHAFVVTRPEAVAGRRVLLIDDVFTTGATVNESAKALLKAGADSVCALTLARTFEGNLIPDRIFATQATKSLKALGS